MRQLPHLLSWLPCNTTRPTFTALHSLGLRCEFFKHCHSMAVEERTGPCAAGEPELRHVCRVDVATAIAPGALVGRAVRVLWPDDSAWFLGEVTTYDPATGHHEV